MQDMCQAKPAEAHASSPQPVAWRARRAGYARRVSSNDPPGAQPAPLARPRISILMPYRNPGAYLRSTLASLLWQTERDWELIAIDDGTNDGSGELEGLRGDARLRWVRHARSAGLAVRLNEAVALARGHYLARMDADDIAFPDRLQRQADWLDAHAEVDLLATSVLVIDGAGQPLGVARSPATHEALVRRAAQRIPMPHPTWMGRAAWFHAHPYDPRAHKAQDQHLLFRTHRRSRFAALDEPLLAYRAGAVSARKSLQSRYHFLRALWSHGSAAQVLRGTAFHTAAGARDLLAQALRWDRRVWRARAEPPDAALLAHWSALRVRLQQEPTHPAPAANA